MYSKFSNYENIITLNELKSIFNSNQGPGINTLDDVRNDDYLKEIYRQEQLFSHDGYKCIMVRMSISKDIAYDEKMLSLLLLPLNRVNKATSIGEIDVCFFYYFLSPLNEDDNLVTMRQVFVARGDNEVIIKNITDLLQEARLNLGTNASIVTDEEVIEVKNSDDIVNRNIARYKMLVSSIPKYRDEDELNELMNYSARFMLKTRSRVNE